MTTPESSRTYHANQAMMLSDLIGIKFSDRRYGTAVRRMVKVTEPDGPSTAGGVQARQSILLVSEDPEGTAGAIVCGWLDTARHTAELRSFAQIVQQYQQRHGVAPDITKTEYDRAVQELHDFLRAQAIDSRVAVVSRRSLVPAPSLTPTPPASDAQLYVVGGVAFFAGFVVCYLLFLARVLGA